MNEAHIFILVGGVLASSLVIAFGASRIGIPSLVAFLGLGMIMGSDGPGNIPFENVHLAQTVGIVGLVAILFEGGLSTSWRRLREVVVPATLLSTVGVFITALFAGLVAFLIFDVPLIYAFLIGAVISSTDAAAVFATVRTTKIKRRLARTLEAESGGNDPMAIALTIGLVGLILEPTHGIENIALLLLQQLGIGLLVGVSLSLLARWTFARLPSSIGAFAPVASVAACAFAFGITQMLGGSGFLAVYLVGLAIGSTPSRYRSQLTAFHEGLAYLAQVIMFVVLGLLVVPHELLAVAGAGLVLALILMVFIRPLAVLLSTMKQGFRFNEQLFLGWAGLRGAVPIILATFVLSSGIDNGSIIFNIVFFVVLLSALFQGATLEFVAEKLKVIDKLPGGIGTVDRNVMINTKFHVMPEHAIVGAYLNEIGLPPKSYVKRIIRDSDEVKPTDKTRIRSNDFVVVTHPSSLQPELEDVFTRWRRRI